MRHGGIVLASIIVGMGTFASTSQAVILYDSSARNTSAPTGQLSNSGWQYEGTWGSFLGTAIASNYFISAQHIDRNPTVGSDGTYGTFTYGGVDYKAIAYYNDPNSDLRIWKINGTLPSYATLYTGSSEVNRTMVDIGRGTQRGTAVVINSTQKGWYWGTSDSVQSWGSDTVAATDSTGHYLAFYFQAGGCTLSSGDSGGGLFIKVGSSWQLAGINYGVVDPYSESANGSNYFYASIYDQSGLYTATNESLTSWTSAGTGPQYSLATRISASSAWINGVLVPEPTMLATILGSAMLLIARRRHEPATSVEE